MAALDAVSAIVPERKIGVALDEFNVKLPPEPGAHSMHEQAYTLRDGLYVAGMLNAFHRQCNTLQIANLALLVNTLPLIVKPEGKPAYPTPLYFPFQLYSRMESQYLSTRYWSHVFHSERLGSNISARNQVPYIDITATRSADRQRVVLGIINRHPLKTAKTMINLKGEENNEYRAVDAQIMTGPDPLSVNTAEAPDTVGVENVKPPKVQFAWLDFELPPASVTLIVLEKKQKK